MPEDIIVNSIEVNPYKRKEKPKILPRITKDHYNTYYNMGTPWKGGYPTIEQVQAGELYFNLPDSKEKKLLIDVRGYWQNVPEWESTAKLLTTPTLDYDRELIFLPQYNKINYMNMETGLNNDQGLIGSRILVYNPGDIPVDFEIKIGNLKKRFRAEDGDYRFRISRYNVQRLPIPCAVDWVNLKPTNPKEEEDYKYGNRYFKILEKEEDELTYRLLENAHPKHCYYVEPIPRERLAHYIKMFYWQSYKLGFFDNTIFGGAYNEYMRGIDIANRYEELYKLCITELEKYQLYWETLRIAIFIEYKKVFSLNETELEQFYSNYVNYPPEYFKEDSNFNRKYDQFDFNLSKLPIYITDDYFEITTKYLWDKDEVKEDYLEASDWGGEQKDTSGSSEKYREQRIPPNLFLDTEKRMLYNIDAPSWNRAKFNEIREKYGKEKLWDEYDDFDNFYNYKPLKTIRNESIVQGKWFKLPPGWSLIDISPVIDETRWGGKLWKDGRPFDWGETSEDDRKEFNKIYAAAAKDYLNSYCPDTIIKTFGKTDHTNFDNYTLPELEECMQFRRWYGEETTNDLYTNNFIITNNYVKPDKNCFLNTLHHKMNEDAEYGFLKRLSSFWIAMNKDEDTNKLKKGKELSSWWWYACNYIWANFPPLYWGYMDLLNELQIKYVPLFY